MIPELNKIYQGDCLEIMRGWPDGCFDVVVTSPPYNMGCFNRNSGKNTYENYEGNDMPEVQYRAWIIEVLREVVRVIKPSGYLAWNMKYRMKDNRVTLPHWIVEHVDMVLRNEIIWKYSGYTDVNKSKFYPGHETVFLFVKSGVTPYFNEELASIGDVWQIPQAIHVDDVGGKTHPAPFPSTIPKRIISATCPRGGWYLILSWGVGRPRWRLNHWGINGWVRN